MVNMGELWWTSQICHNMSQLFGVLMSLAILRRGMRPGGMTFSGTHMDPERIQLGEKMKNVCILGAGSLSFFFGFFLTYLA